MIVTKVQKDGKETILIALQPTDIEDITKKECVMKFANVAITYTEQSEKEYRELLKEMADGRVQHKSE